MEGLLYGLRREGVKGRDVRRSDGKDVRGEEEGFEVKLGEGV